MAGKCTLDEIFLDIILNLFEPIKTLNNEVYKLDELSLPDIWVYSNITEDKIYIPVNDKNIYKIKVFDHDGNLIEEIVKNYHSILFTDTEYKKMKYYAEKTQQGTINRSSLKYKRAVVGIHDDKYGNIIAQPAVNTSKGNADGMHFDFSGHKYEYKKKNRQQYRG